MLPDRYTQGYIKNTWTQTDKIFQKKNTIFYLKQMVVRRTPNAVKLI